LRTEAQRWQPAAVAALAAAVFLWQLGASSIFVDESNTLRMAQGSLDGLFDILRRFETSPPTYFLLIHGWMSALGADQEWVARLPSALAGVALAVVVWRLGERVFDSTTGLIAGVLTAVSPLVLGYAQQARVYTALMLAVTVAILCAIEAERRESTRWLAAAAASAVLALCLHYIAAFVVGPLALWVLVRTRFSLRWRLGVAGATAVAVVVWLPLMREQFGYHPNGGLGELGEFSLSHAARVLGAPFDPRYAQDAWPAGVVGAGVFAASVAIAAVAWGRRRSVGQELVLATAVAVPGFLLLASLLGRNMLVSRYATVAVPLMLIVIAAGVASAPRRLGIGLLCVALALGLWGTTQTHRSSGFFPDTRGVAEHLDANWRTGDALIDSTDFGVNHSVGYYLEARAAQVEPRIVAGTDAAENALEERRRVWLLDFGAGEGAVGVPRSHEPVRTLEFRDGPGLTLTLARRVARTAARR
jgi:4-amino-4-deoxy-L-arabinose transferase-like glycosyltransferase